MPTITERRERRDILKHYQQLGKLLGFDPLPIRVDLIVSGGIVEVSVSPYGHAQRIIFCKTDYDIESYDEDKLTKDSSGDDCYQETWEESGKEQ